MSKVVEFDHAVLRLSTVKDQVGRVAKRQMCRILSVGGIIASKRISPSRCRLRFVETLPKVGFVLLRKC